MPRKKSPDDEVDPDELKKAILAMIVEKFGHRKLTWETCERALQLAIFEIKQAALFAPRGKK